MTITLNPEEAAAVAEIARALRSRPEATAQALMRAAIGGALFARPRPLQRKREPHPLMPIGEVATLLNLSVRTVRVRARSPGDPLHVARSRIGCQKPMHFHREEIESIHGGPR